MTEIERHWEEAIAFVLVLAMIYFYRPRAKMTAAVNLITLDIPGWSVHKKLKTQVIWKNEVGEKVLVTFLDVPSEMPCQITDEKGIRDLFREHVNNDNGGIISVDVVEVCGQYGIASVCKYWEKTSGLKFVAALSFPFKRISFTITASYVEVGQVGIRESLVLAQLLDSGEITQDDVTKKPGPFCCDPYDSSCVSPVMRTRADDELYDGLIPIHPLTRARIVMQQIIAGVRFHPDIVHFV